jgi:hypothetical protein
MELGINATLKSSKLLPNAAEQTQRSAADKRRRRRYYEIWDMSHINSKQAKLVQVRVVSKRRKLYKVNVNVDKLSTNVKFLDKWKIRIKINGQTSRKIG